MENSINARIALLIKYLRLTQQDFARRVGVNQNSLSYTINGKTKPGYLILHKIAITFPTLNTRWLLTGEGAMWDATPEEAGLDAINPIGFPIGSTSEGTQRLASVMDGMLTLIRNRLELEGEELKRFEELEVEVAELLPEAKTHRK